MTRALSFFGSPTTCHTACMYFDAWKVERLAELFDFVAGGIRRGGPASSRSSFPGLVLVDDAFRRERILVVLGVEEHACQRVVVPRRNRIVLVIVAARARDGQAEEAAADRVHAVVALVGVRDFDRAVVVVPGPRPRKPSAGRLAQPHVLSSIRSAASCARDELVVRHVVVERLDDPVAVEVRVADTDCSRGASDRGSGNRLRRSARRRATSGPTSRRSCGDASRRSTTFANASGELSARNASISSGVGGMPVRSSVARRISARLSAGATGFSPSLSSFARM